MRRKIAMLMRIWSELCTEHFHSAFCLVLGLVEQECSSQRIQDLPVRELTGVPDTLNDQEFSLPTMQREDVLLCQIQADPIAPPMANLNLGSQPLTEAKDSTASSKS